MGMRLLLATILGVSLSSGCVSKGALDLTFAGSDEDFAHAQDAAALWNDACGFTVYVHRGGDGISLEGFPEPLYLEDGERIGAHTFIWYGGPLGDHPLRIRYDTTFSWTRDKLTLVLAHEMGHAMGLVHESSGIMFYAPTDGTVTPQNCRDAEDR